MRSKLCCNSVRIRSQTLFINRVSVLVSLAAPEMEPLFCSTSAAGSRLASCW